MSSRMYRCTPATIWFFSYFDILSVITYPTWGIPNKKIRILHHINLSHYLNRAILEI